MKGLQSTANEGGGTASGEGCTGGRLVVSATGRLQ